MTRYHWPRVMVNGGTAATALAAAIAACVNDGPNTVHCSPNLECAPNWLCTETGDACYPATCGDGIHNLRSGELCDDGNAVDGDGCSGHCLFLDRCGDGIVDPGETCDDGNTVAGDGCNARCRSDEMCLNSVVDPLEECDQGEETATCDDDCTEPHCGDRNPNPLAGEVCDQGMSTETCDADCSLPMCGDGLHNAAAGEKCDDGIHNASSGGCLPGCKLAACGDGYVWENVEECGDGPGVAPTDQVDCDADCTMPVCGDGYLNEVAGEQCDDGNTSVNDACPSGVEAPCRLARCGDGFIHVGFEDCEPPLAPNGLPMNSFGCDQDCTAPSCGDGVFNPLCGEECDDGNRLDIDACRDSLEGGCQEAACGDGVVYLGVEQCDDGNDDIHDTCLPGCQLARCGDAVVQTGREDCDAGGDTADCDRDCTFSVCGDGYRNMADGEECDQNVPCDDPRQNCILTGLENRCLCI